jgi:hypothetical protein
MTLRNRPGEPGMPSAPGALPIGSNINSTTKPSAPIQKNSSIMMVNQNPGNVPRPSYPVGLKPGVIP